MSSYQYRTKKHCGKRNHEQGFTLIEILFAVAVLAFGLLAVSSLQGSAIRGNLMALDRTEAVAWAQTQMESLMALPYNDVVSGGPTVQGIYTINWNVINNDPIFNCKRITVTVTYQEKKFAAWPVVLTSSNQGCDHGARRK
jgi:prepilin-type N-terminal cleavage/methylation domain-containing protein